MPGRESIEASGLPSGIPRMSRFPDGHREPLSSLSSTGFQKYLVGSGPRRLRPCLPHLPDVLWTKLVISPLPKVAWKDGD